MLNEIDDIDWSALDGAYGPCTEAPDILRGLASPDPRVVADAAFEFSSSIWHQGTVYPVTEVVIPFLVELAVTPGVLRRDHLLRYLGEFCDPGRSNGAAQPMVRAAVAVHSGPLTPLLGDPDPAVRACAAYALAWSGPHAEEAVRERWAAETDPETRAALLLGLAHLGAASSVPLVEAALRDPAPEVRVSAAVATARAGRSLADADPESIADAFGAADDRNNPWRGHRSLFMEVLDTVDAGAARALAGRTASAGPTPARIELAGILGLRFQRSRTAPEVFLPVVRDLLADPVAEVRRPAVEAMVAAGEAAAPMAQALLTAAHDDDRAVAGTAIGALMLLGHPGYREPLLAAWAADHEVRLPEFPEPPPFDAAVLAAMRGRLASLLPLVTGWGPAAAAAVPEIVALLPAEPVGATRALLAIGAPGALPAVPALTQLAAGGDIEAGHAVFRLTGDTGPLLTAAAGTPAGRPRFSAYDLGLVAEAGPAAAPLVPALRQWLTGEAAERPDDRYDQVAAARVVWRATGDTDLVMPTVRAVVRAGGTPAGTAASLIAELGAGQDLLPELRRLLRAGLHGRCGAARALHRLGVPGSELAEPVVAAVAAGSGAAGEAVETLIAIGAAGALHDLAERDERLGRTGRDEASWADDVLRRRMRAAIG